MDDVANDFVEAEAPDPRSVVWSVEFVMTEDDGFFARITPRDGEPRWSLVRGQTGVVFGGLFETMVIADA